MLGCRGILGSYRELPVPYGLGRIGVHLPYEFVSYVWALSVEVQFYVAIAAMAWWWNTARDSKHMLNATPVRVIVSIVVLGGFFLGAILWRVEILRHFSYV